MAAAWGQLHLVDCLVQLWAVWATSSTSKQSCRSWFGMKETDFYAISNLRRQVRMVQMVWSRRPLIAACDSMGHVCYYRYYRCIAMPCRSQRKVIWPKCWKELPFKADHYWVHQNASTWTWPEQPLALLWQCHCCFQALFSLVPLLGIPPATFCPCCNLWNNRASKRS